MDERDIKPVERLLRVAPTGKVKDIWPYHTPFYRNRKEEPQKRKPAPRAEQDANKAHPTPEHIGEKIDFNV